MWNKFRLERFFFGTERKFFDKNLMIFLLKLHLNNFIQFFLIHGLRYPQATKAAQLQLHLPLLILPVLQLSLNFNSTAPQVLLKSLPFRLCSTLPPPVLSISYRFYRRFIKTETFLPNCLVFFQNFQCFLKLFVLDINCEMV